MTAPRVDIDLAAISANAAHMVRTLTPLGISVCGVTKATLGCPEVAHALVTGGVGSIGESRIENIERLRRAGFRLPMTLIRSPMLSQVDQVVQWADTSLNSEIDVIAALSDAAYRRRRRHRVVIMVELGDVREGVLPRDLIGISARSLELRGIELVGIGTNLGCQHGVAPDDDNMAELSALCTLVETTHGVKLPVVSGGNSANLNWALTPGARIGRVSELRLGESLLMGREPLQRRTLEGLTTGAFTLVGEVIESKEKPSEPRGTIGCSSFGDTGDLPRSADLGRGPHRRRAIVALGHHDTDPAGLSPPPGYRIVGASSDHLIVETAGTGPRVGTEVTFDMDYSALIRAMASPLVATNFVAPAQRPVRSPPVPEVV